MTEPELAALAEGTIGIGPHKAWALGQAYRRDLPAEERDGLLDAFWEARKKALRDKRDK